jgi:hypothetical protein
MPKGAGVTQRSASILIEADEAAHAALCALQTAYSNACNLLVEDLTDIRSRIILRDLFAASYLDPRPYPSHKGPQGGR